ncbi:MAG TPA: hypothetical protein PLO37_17835 [Candidatus Hydrogenedentes bacterium]|nr:hypothetical protein [Candidatus Hydrogenedentota bacterium]HPG68711.1 hypothetical protein [Candidatus Hydrogenedentota bacterium]
MKFTVTLTDLGEDTEDKAEVIAWMAGLGNAVQEGDDLIELTTDKAAFTVPSPVSGVLTEQLVGEGDAVFAGQALGVVETEAG